MIKLINFITFKGHDKTYYAGENKIVKCFSDNNKLLSCNEYDKFDRHVHTTWFDESGNCSGFMHKKYLDDGYIETCKTRTQEYTRTIRNFIENGFKHQTEEYVSKTKPEANYFNESIRDTFGKLVKIISNKKVIFEL